MKLRSYKLQKIAAVIMAMVAGSTTSFALAQGEDLIVTSKPVVTQTQTKQDQNIVVPEIFKNKIDLDNTVSKIEKFSGQSVTVDPKLAHEADPQTEEIKNLTAQVELLQDELKKARDALGVKPKTEPTVTNIPAVPVSVVTNNVPKYQNSKTSNAQSNEISVQPGVNQIVTIAVGQTNRLITPFSNPQVASSNLTGGDLNGAGGELSVKDNVVYVSTNKTYPTSLFITDEGNENLAISLTLVPRKIPSREVKLNLNSDDYELSYSSQETEAWEKSQPFISGIKKTLREIALQRVPAGYQLSKIPKNYDLPVCASEGFNVDFSKGQLIAGSKLHYLVGKVTNVSAHPLEFRESTCGNYDIAAVALWPNNLLEPGQSSEIYVVKHASGRKQLQQVRSSVLDK